MGHWAKASSIWVPRGMSSIEGTKAFPSSGRCKACVSWAIMDPALSQVGSYDVKDRSKPGGSSGSENELRVRVLWLSWLKTGDNPMSTDPWVVLVQWKASTVEKSWADENKVWASHSLLQVCTYVLWSCAAPVYHWSSGSEVWLHWAVMSGSESVSGGVGGRLGPPGRDWHQLSTLPGSEKRNPGQFRWESSSLMKLLVSLTSRHGLNSRIPK